MVPVSEALKMLALAFLIGNRPFSLGAREKIEEHGLGMTHGFDHFLIKRADAVKIHEMERIPLVPDVLPCRKIGQAIFVARDADTEINGNIPQGIFLPVPISFTR